MKISRPLFSQIVSEYRSRQRMSLRVFAKKLSSNIGGKTISHETVRNWERASQLPTYHVFLPIALMCGDWRRDFAFDALAALNPSLFTPIGDIGKRLLTTNGPAVEGPETVSLQT